MDFRILITSSRSWTDHERIHQVLDEYTHIPRVVLVSGNCRKGGDLICENYADSVGWHIERHPADWNQYGKRAGFVRNAEMVNLRANVCLAFIRNASKGATMTKNLAQKAGIETRVFRDDSFPYLNRMATRSRRGL